MAKEKGLGGALDISSEDSDSDDDLFAYLNTKGRGKIKLDIPKPNTDFVNLEDTLSDHNQTSQNIDCDVNKQQSIDNGTKMKFYQVNLENKSSIETQTPCDTDFDVCATQYLHHGSTMDITVHFSTDKTTEHKTEHRRKSTKAGTTDPSKPSKPKDVKKSTVKKKSAKSKDNLVTANRSQRKKKTDLSTKESQGINQSNRSKKTNSKNFIRETTAIRNDLRSISAEMSSESWSPSNTEEGKQLVADRVNEYLASFKTFDKFKSQEQDISESNWEKSMMSRDSENESMFSSPMKIEVSLIEQDVTPIHSPVSIVKNDRQNVSEENQAFIPNIRDGSRPLQYKFVRDGNKLKRITVVQESDPSSDILVDGVYHQANINNIGVGQENTVRTQAEAIKNEKSTSAVGRTGIEMNENLQLTDIEENHDFEEITEVREDYLNEKQSNVKEKCMIIKTLEAKRDLSIDEITETEKNYVNQGMRENENDDIDVETIEHDNLNLITSKTEQSSVLVQPPETTENVGEIEIHDSGVSIDSDHQSTGNDYLYATVYEGTTPNESVSLNTYGNSSVSGENSFTEYGKMNKTMYDSSVGSDTGKLQASSANEAFIDYAKVFNEKYRRESGQRCEDTKQSNVQSNNNLWQNNKYNDSEIIKKTDTDFVQYLENTCLSENASTSSQVSLCSNESPIVLKLGADGKLTECKTCPASHGWQEKKTEMDISFLAMRIQKIENDLSEMRRKSISETPGNTGTLKSVLHEESSTWKLELNEDKCTNINNDLSMNITNSSLIQENNLSATKVSTSEKNVGTHKQSSQINFAEEYSFKETIDPGELEVGDSARANSEKENTNYLLTNQAIERKHSQSVNVQEMTEGVQRPSFGSSVIHHKVKSRESTVQLEVPKAFENLESPNISTSSFASSSTDDSGQEDLGEYMVLEEEQLQTLFLQKLAEVKQIQSALKRKNRSKSKNSNAVGKKEIHCKVLKRNEKDESMEAKERKVTRKSVCKSAKKVASKTPINVSKNQSSKTENACETESSVSLRKQTKSDQTGDIKHISKEKSSITCDIKQSSRSTKNLKRMADKVDAKRAKVKKKVTWNEKENNVKNIQCNTPITTNKQKYGHENINKSIHAANVISDISDSDISKTSSNVFKGLASPKIKTNVLDITSESNSDLKGALIKKTTSKPTAKKDTSSSPKHFIKMSPQTSGKKRKLSADSGLGKDDETANSTYKHKRKARLQAQTRIVEALENHQDILKYEYEIKSAVNFDTHRSPKTELEKLCAQVEYKRRKIHEIKRSHNEGKELTESSEKSAKSESQTINVSSHLVKDRDDRSPSKSPNKSQDVESKRRRLETIISEKLKSPQILNNESTKEHDNKVSKDSHSGIKENTPTSKVRNKLGSAKSKLREAKLKSHTKTKQFRQVQKKSSNKGIEKRKNEKKSEIKSNSKSTKKCHPDKKIESLKIRKKGKPKQKYGSSKTFEHRKRLAKSYDETWKDKLDSHAFSAEVLSLNDGVKKPINVKRLLKKILVPSDPAKSESLTDCHKHNRRRRDKRVTQRSSSTKDLKSSGLELELSRVDVCKNTPVSFPGMLLGESTSTTSGEYVEIRNDENMILTQNCIKQSDFDSSRGHVVECSNTNETDSKGIPPKLENESHSVSITNEKQIVTNISNDMVSVCEQEIKESSESEEITGHDSVSNEAGLTEDNKIPSDAPSKSDIIAVLPSPNRNMHTDTSIHSESSPGLDRGKEKTEVLTSVKKSPHKSTFDQFKSLMDRRNNLFVMKNKDILVNPLQVKEFS